MNNKLKSYIEHWQLKNDTNFKSLPNDEHSSLIFNHKNEIIQFIFSNQNIRDNCKMSIPLELLNNYTYIIEQENGLTFYDFT